MGWAAAPIIREAFKPHNDLASGRLRAFDALITAHGEVKNRLSGQIADELVGCVRQHCRRATQAAVRSKISIWSLGSRSSSMPRLRSSLVSVRPN